MPYIFTYMRIIFTIFLSVVFAGTLAAQCDLEVEIKANPGADLCLGESVQLIAVTNQEVEIPADCETVADLSCEVGSVPFSANLDNGTSVNSQGASLPDVFGDINEGAVRSQIIYRASELIAAGFEGGKIRGLEFEIASVAGGGTISNLEIQMGCTPDADFGSSFTTTPLSTVFDKKSVSVATGYNSFTFDRAYNWNGVDNIIIQICIHEAAGQPGNFKNYTRDQFLSFPALRAARKIISDGGCTFTDNARNSNQRPNTRFITCKPELKDFTYSWTPVASLSDATARDPLASPTENITYSVEVFETNNPGCVATDQIDINVIDPGDFEPNANTPLCEGTNLGLNSNTVADGYLWVGPDGYTSTNANPIITNVTPAASGTYTVFVDKGICKASKTVDVEVESPLSAGTPLPDPVLCNNLASFSLFDLLDGQDVNATSEWTDLDGSGVLAGNNIQPINLPDNVLPQTFDYKYSVENSCGLEESFVQVTIHPAPEAGDDGVGAVCNNDNSLIDLRALLEGDPDGDGVWIDFDNTGEMNPNGTVNLFGFDAGQYEFFYKVTGPGACEADSNKVTITVENYEVAGTGGTARVCRGESLNLFDFLTGNAAGGLWVDVNGSNGLVDPVNGAVNTTTMPPGSYQFNYLIDNPDPCTDELATVEVQVTKKPEIVDPTTFCNQSETFYQVRFEVQDGDINTLDVSVTADNIDYGFDLEQLGGSWFVTTDPIPEGEEVFIEISDADACGVSTYSIRKRCGCVTDAGVINVVPTQTICEGSEYTVSYVGGFISDGDDINEFILHDNPTDAIGTVFDRNQTGTFGFVDGLQEGETYYISVIAGTAIGDQVDLDDDCIDVREGQPVRFITLPEVSLSRTPDTTCIGGDVTLSAAGVDGTVDDFTWVGPNVTSNQLEFEIPGINPAGVGQYNFTIEKGICDATFSIDVPAYPVPEISVPTNFVACEAVLDSIPIEYTGVTGTARFLVNQNLVNVPLISGTNYLRRSFTEAQTVELRELDYPTGCSMDVNKNINVTLEQAPDITFELASPQIICSSADPQAQIQFSFDPPSATGNIQYEVSGFQFTEEPEVGNDSVLTVPAIFEGPNTFRVRRYFSSPKGCSYAANFGSVTFFNYQEPQVSFEAENTKICRGDTAFIPISVSASDTVIIEYSVAGVSQSLVTTKDTVIPVFENTDFVFSLDTVYYNTGNGCGGQLNLVDTFEVKDPINFAATAVKNDCKDNTNGRILLQADGAGTAFSLDGNTYFQRESFDNLAPGEYTVFARAESGCISVRTVSVTNKSNLELDINQSPTTCGNINGSLQVTALQGSEPYIVEIGGIQFPNGQLRENLPSGAYPIYAYDNLLCEVRDTVVIGPSTGVDFVATENGPLDCDFPDNGVITVDATGGSGNYTYQLNEQPPQASNEFNGLFAQFYTVRVIDADDGCIKTKRVRIKPRIPFALNAKILRGLNCSYSEDGRIEAVVQGDPRNYSYSLDGVTYSSQNVFNNVKEGQFTLFARENSECRREQDFRFNLTAPPPVQTRVNYTEDVICWNGTDGLAGISASGGSGAPYKYKEAGDGGFVSSSLFANLGQGLHTFVSKDVNGCLDTIRVRINGPDTVQVTVTKIDSADSKATVLFNATNTFLITEYSLDGVNYTSNPVFPALEPGTYTLYVRDQLGCITLFTFNLTVTGISEVAAKQFSVFPNPFVGNITMQFKQPLDPDATEAVRLFGINGQQIPISARQTDGNTLELQLPPETAPGMYLLQYQDQTVRLMKQ